MKQSVITSTLIQTATGAANPIKVLTLNLRFVEGLVPKITAFCFTNNF